MPSNTRYSLLYVTKVELNDVIETIAEIDDDQCTTFIIWMCATTISLKTRQDRRSQEKLAL